MSRPTRSQLDEFINIVEKLCIFEAEQRQIRGVGLFKKEDLPLMSIVDTLDWLRYLEEGESND